jgi:uncharacterized protein YggE
VRLVTALAALAALAAAGAAAAQPAVTLAPGETLLSIQADGSVRARPDTMTIAAGVVTTGATAGEAVAANSALAERLVATIRGAGIEARDVQTANFRVQPRFEGGRDRDSLAPDGRPPMIVGYVVENGLSVQLRDLGKAREIISRLFEAGANSVSGPRFSLSGDRARAAEQAAERAAIAEATAKAENYAAAMGRRVGRVLRVSERRAWTDTNFDGIVVSGSRIAPTPIEPGEITTNATIFVDYALVPQ